MANGLYLRLSIADGDLGKENKDESNSIDNQRSLLVNFITDREDMSDEYIEYVDDGYSGTNFDRPAFKKMIEDAKSGKIDTVIVKDFSRFGRDYIGVGDYLEQVFPLLGIRFISLNNNYDSKARISWCERLPSERKSAVWKLPQILSLYRWWYSSKNILSP